MRYLTFNEILSIHNRMIKLFGGEGGILSEESLENCVALPMMSIFGTEPSPSLWAKAATLLHCITVRHPFIDGNKRTAWTAARVFLLLNGYRLVATTEAAEDIVLGVTSGDIILEDLAGWIEEHSEAITV
jgi:death-on-curing protein